MQQKSSSQTTSNLQIKLITDARKLLEKVRSQQALSADSSFDSSFLFDGIVSPDLKDVKDALKKAKGSRSGNDGKRNQAVNAIDTPEALDIPHQVSEVSGDVSPPSPLSGSERSLSESRRESENENEDENENENEKSSNESNQEVSTSKDLDHGRPPKVPKQPKEPTITITKKHQHQPDDKSVEEILQDENIQLKQENSQLNREMDDFEYKLYCIEQTLGILEGVQKNSQDSNSIESRNPSTGIGSRVNYQEDAQRPAPIPLGENPLLPNGMDYNRLSPVTALLADSMISASGAQDINKMNNTNYDRDAPTSSTQIFPEANKENEIRMLRENNEKMVTAIRALAQATVAQTRKHYLYKRRHRMTKKLFSEESGRNDQLMVEKEEAISSYYETRTSFLKEQDMREELASECQLLAKKNNTLRSERERQEEMRRKILDRVECRDDTASVLSRLSESSCFPILQTITENGQSHQHENRSDRSSRDHNNKNVEKLVFKLISQLKRRDGKIEKLQKKLKVSMQYLEGALELEVARQDADIVSQGSATMAGSGNSRKSVISEY